LTISMNILHVISSDGADLGDYIFSLLTRLPYNWRSCVVGSLSRRLRSRLSQGNIQWVNVQMPAVDDRAGHSAVARRLGRILRSFGAEIVHSHNVSAQVCTFMAARRIKPPPVQICSLHTSLADKAGWWMRRLQRRALTGADAVVVASEAEREALCYAIPGLQPRTHVIYHGVERKSSTTASDPGMRRNRLGLASHTAVVGIISPLRAGLGLESLIRAAAVVQDRLPNIEFLVIGDGPQREELQSLAHTLGLTGAMLFVGERADVSDIIPVLNVLVLTTDAVAAPLRGLEALACNVAVVAADSGGLREIFEPLPKTTIFEQGNVEQLADAICRQLEITHVEAMTGAVTEGETGIGVSEKDMLGSELLYDLDTRGLEPELAATDKPLTAAEIVQRRFSISSMVARIERLYQDLHAESLGAGRAVKRTNRANAP